MVKKAKCVKMSIQPGSSIIVSGVKQKEKNGSLGPGNFFKNLNFGKGLISYSAQLLLFVEIDEKIISIRIDKKFRKKFTKPGRSHANFTEKRIKRIYETMPNEIEVIKGNGCFEYEVADYEIDAWYARL